MAFDIGYELTCLAGTEVGLDAIFEGGGPQLLEATYFSFGEWLVLELLECATAPQTKRFLKDRGGKLRVAFEQRGTFMRSLHEIAGVDGRLCHVELVTVIVARQDHALCSLGTVRLEDRPETRDVDP